MDLSLWSTSAARQVTGSHAPLITSLLVEVPQETHEPLAKFAEKYRINPLTTQGEVKK